MMSSDFGAVVRAVHTLWDVGSMVALSDVQLLERFRIDRDPGAEAAFEAIVRRHGPMVLRVCRGVLRDEHAAEDALQATFLILARRSASIRKQNSLASWLFGVARRVATRAHAERCRRATHERRGAIMSRTISESSPAPAELMPEIQEELDRLTEKYRSPVILCYLEGLTHEEAASRLSVPVGTVKTRLSRARGRLRGRLLRRGLAPAGLGMTVAGRADTTISQCVVDSIVKSAVAVAAGRAAGVSSSVTALVEGVQKAMFITKLKTSAALVGTSATLIFAGFLAIGLIPQSAQSKPDSDPISTQTLVSAPGRTVTSGDTEAEISGVQTVKKANFKRTISRTGSVIASRRVNLYPKVSGELTNVNVKIGDFVAKGQPVAEIDAREIRADLQKSKALLDQARARLARADSAVKLAAVEVDAQRAKIESSRLAQKRAVESVHYREKIRDRIKSLVAKGSVETEILDEAEDQLQIASAAQGEALIQTVAGAHAVEMADAKRVDAQAGHAEAIAAAQAATADVARAEIRASYTTIAAPMDGIVTARDYEVGEFVRSVADGGAQPLLTLVNRGLVRVVVEVPDGEVSKLDVGDPVTVRLPGEATRQYPGSIARTAFEIDPKHRSLHTEIDLDNKDGSLRPGVLVGVEITLEDRPDQIALPRSAIFERIGDRGYCFRVVDGHAVKTQLELGIENPSQVLVESGLKEGDAVVIDAGSVTDGQVIPEGSSGSLKKPESGDSKP
jgi:HlyD family secretion protein